MGSMQPDQPIAFSLRVPLPDATEAGCSAATSPTPIDAGTVMGPAPFWFVMERATASCGSFQLALAAP